MAIPALHSPNEWARPEAQGRACVPSLTEGRRHRWENPSAGSELLPEGVTELPGSDTGRMALLLVVALGALCPLLARAEPPAATINVTAAMGQDACLPCGTQSWAELRGATIGCSHRAGDGPGVTVLFHRLDGHGPPFEPGWLPPEQPQSRFRGRVAFCPSGTGDGDVSVLVRNISDGDFGNYFCHADRDAGPQFLCMVELQPAGAASSTGVPNAAGPDTLLVSCALTATVTAVAIGAVLCARRQRHCWRSRGRRVSSAMPWSPPHENSFLVAFMSQQISPLENLVAV